MRFVLLLVLLAHLAGCTASRLIQEDHPLNGRVWDVSEQRFISPQEAETRIAAADFALLGETHDNPAHHQLQAHLLQRVTAQGRHPALAMEQFDTEWQKDMDAARAKAASATAIAQAGHISPGWEWPGYRPLVVQALKEKLPVVAANLSRPRARTIASDGLTALGSGEAERLGLDQEWTSAQNATLRKLLVNGHCGNDSPMIDKLITVQRSKDAVMADRILASPTGSVAILGRAHARKDIGVPLYLQERAPDKRFLSLGLVEVDTGKASPADYPDAAPGGHDLVWFTPRVRRSNPCDRPLPMQKS